MSRISFGVWAAMVLMLATLAGAQSYTVTDLGEIGSATGAAVAINDNGAVVGGYISGDLEHAFLWTSKEGRRDLGTLSGYDQSSATGINNSGQVVGYCESTAGFYAAFIWTQKGGMQDLGSLGGNDTLAFGINDSGQVVGYSALANGINIHAFLWTASGGMQDLGTLDGADSSNATAINQFGVVVGASNVLDDPADFHGFLWTQPGGMQDLGVLGTGVFSEGSAVNASGQVFGVSTTSPTKTQTQAIYWTQSRGMQSLGVGVNSTALGANDSEEVVGSSDNDQTAFLWTPTDHDQNLNNLIPPNSGWNLKFAYAINRIGQIAATGTLNQKMHAALLTPTN
jgi:probable HAF family extracellular repeat protein